MAVVIGAALHLLRAGVLRRHQPLAGQRVFDPARQRRAFEQLGDAEVEQARHAVGVDQDVRGLDVAVDHQVLMGVLHRGADLAEEVDPGVESQAVLGRSTVEGHALDVLHDQVGPAVVGGAAVEEARDAGVVEGGQDLPLGAEPRREVGAVRPVAAGP